MKQTPVNHLKRTILEILRAHPDESMRRNELSKTLHIPATSNDYQYIVQALVNWNSLAKSIKSGDGDINMHWLRNL